MDRRREALAVVAEISGRDLHTLTAETELVADLGIDSVKALELVVALEARLGIEISDEVATRTNTVGDLLGFLAAP